MFAGGLFAIGLAVLTLFPLFVYFSITTLYYKLTCDIRLTSNWKLSSMKYGMVWAACSMAMFIYVGICVLFYVLARVSIIIESFISLRHATIGVYETPDLDIMGYVPHIN